MTLRSFPGGFYFPDPPTRDGQIGYAPLALTASTHQVASIIQIPKSGEITKIAFRTGTVATGDTVDVRLEGVDLSNGDPDGTLYDTNSNGAQVITIANAWHTVTLTGAATVAKGDLVAAVIVNGAVPGDLQIVGISWTGNGQLFPYNDHFLAAWTKQNASAVIGLEYDDGSYAYTPGNFPLSAITAAAYAVSSTPDERALRIKIPFGARCTGWWAELNVGNPLEVILYEGTTALANMTFTVDPDVKTSSATRIYNGHFAGTAELKPNTVYYLGIRPTAGGITMTRMTVDSVALWDAFSGGQEIHAANRADQGSWSDITDERIVGGLIFDALDDGAPMNLTGGMQ